MARVSQFAKDMGMTYNEANNLVKKGRKLQDGGSQILEKTMSDAEKKKKKKKKNKNETNEDMLRTAPMPVRPKEKFNPEDMLRTAPMTVLKDMDFDPRMMLRRKLGGGNNLKPVPADAKGLQALKKERPDVVAEMGFKKKGGTLKMKSGGTFRGCGAQVKGKKFKGIF
jgi:hypothetical protein